MTEWQRIKQAWLGAWHQLRGLMMLKLLRLALWVCYDDTERILLADFMHYFAKRILREIHREVSQRPHADV